MFLQLFDDWKCLQRLFVLSVLKKCIRDLAKEKNFVQRCQFGLIELEDTQQRVKRVLLVHDFVRNSVL